ncbi:hypothetical protein [Methylorubrum rhodesianum]|uniref:hypothetical protein n=1 Tax=Methylorubrum rhodesianum TaxID=29427 RepID=UPI001FED7753|nr:hypothetical protein [Methylorubrum rhodesianum]
MDQADTALEGAKNGDMDGAPERVLGRPQVRIEGRAKVTGAALYASDRRVRSTAHAALVTSTIARGRIRSFDLAAAEAVPDLLGIFTHRDFAGAIAPVPHLMAGGYANSSHLPLGSDRVAYAGQIVALVVGRTPEAAARAAALVGVDYAPEPAAATFDDPGAETVRLADLKAHHEDIATGDPVAAWREAAARVQVRYTTPVQHHNPCMDGSCGSCMDGSCGSRISIGLGELVGCGHVYGV